MGHEKERRPWVFYYDGECGFCTASIRLLACADILRKVDWTAYQDLPNLPAGLTREQLDEAAYLVTGDAGPVVGDGEPREAGSPRLYRGFYAFRMLTLRLPPLFPLALLFWIPGFDRLGEYAYSWVAENRYRISRRCRLKSGR